MPVEKAIELDGGFSTADAEYPTMSLDQGTLQVRFRDWQEKDITLRFMNVCAFKWQEASSHGPEPRDDTAYEILNSAWVAAHQSEQVRAEAETLRHFKLCFNASGVLEVVASALEVAA